MFKHKGRCAICGCVALDFVRTPAGIWPGFAVCCCYVILCMCVHAHPANQGSYDQKAVLLVVCWAYPPIYSPTNKCLCMRTRSADMACCDVLPARLPALVCVSCSNAPFEFYDPASPIYTSPRFLPPAKIEEGCSVSVSRRSLTSARLKCSAWGRAGAVGQKCRAGAAAGAGQGTICWPSGVCFEGGRGHQHSRWLLLLLPASTPVVSQS